MFIRKMLEEGEMRQETVTKTDGRKVDVNHVVSDSPFSSPLFRKTTL